MIKKIVINTAQVLAAMAILAILFLMAYKGSDLLLYLFSLTMMGLAVMVVFYVSYAVIRGEMPKRFGGNFSRRASPVNFWFQAGIYILFSVFLFFLGLALLGKAPHWFMVLLKNMSSRH